MHVQVNADGLAWFWTPILPDVGLAPDAALEIDLRTKEPSPNAFVVLFNQAQLRAATHLSPRQGQRSVTGDTDVSSFLRSTWRGSFASGSVNATVKLHDAVGPLRYSLGVLQATRGAVRGISGEVAFANPGGDQLPLQQHGMSTVFLFMAWAFLGSAAFLLVLTGAPGGVRNLARGRSRLHLMLLAALLVKCLVLLLIRRDIKALSQTGRESVPRQVVWQFLRQVQRILEVLMFYFIGLGWKVMRSQLRPSEWAFAATVCAISLFLGSIEVACGTIASCGGQSYMLTQFTLHSLCFLVVIIGTNFNIFTLQRQIAEALATPETGMLYAKHRAYCWFRGFFLYYVIIPSITNFLAIHVVSWGALWVIVLVREASLWIIYTAVVYLFRPGQRQLKVFDLAVVDSSGESDDSQE